MSVNLKPPKPASLHPVPGVRLGVAEAGIRKANRKDVTLIELAAGSRVAGVFTTNRFCAAPVQVCKAHLAAAEGIRALVINTGIANAGTGELGLANSKQTCDAVAALLGASPSSVLPFSTGVILEHLPMDRLIAGLPAARQNLRDDGWFDAAHAIMTTDTIAKAVSRQIEIGGATVTLTGMSKGAGMIKPNMATMLGFLATDAAISQPLLETLVEEAAGLSFNSITIDGDTSTNDAFVLMATQRAGHPVIRSLDSAAGRTLARAEELYRTRYGTPDGKVTATFQFVFMSGWAPDPSQQKPLAPGSARARLADALNTEERSAGDKASFPERKSKT